MNSLVLANFRRLIKVEILNAFGGKHGAIVLLGAVSMTVTRPPVIVPASYQNSLQFFNPLHPTSKPSRNHLELILAL